MTNWIKISQEETATILKLIMEDNRTELQKKFEEQTPTIIGKRPIEYLQTFCSWLHLQVEKKGQELPINGVSNNEVVLKAFVKEYIEAFEKEDDGNRQLYYKAKSLL